MKPKYLLKVGDKVITRKGVIGTIIKIENVDHFTLKTESGLYRCSRECCKEYNQENK